MLNSLVNCLTAADAYGRAAARRRHISIMARFEATLATHDNRKLGARELCAAMGVSALGGFQTTFTGSVPSGFCPISVPFGDPEPPQTFQVAAIGSISGKSASTTAGPFTCPGTA